MVARAGLQYRTWVMGMRIATGLKALAMTEKT